MTRHAMIHGAAMLLALGCGASDSPGPSGTNADLNGTWLGAARDWSMLIQLTSTAEGQVQGSGSVVGRRERFTVTGTVRGSEVDLRFDPGGGLLPIRYSADAEGPTLTGELDGSGFRDDALELSRLDPSHPAVRGVEWSLVTPTAGAGLQVRGDLWLVSSSTGLHVSRDAGRTWTTPVQGSVGIDAIGIHPTDPSRIAVGVGQAVTVSEDGGVTWREVMRFAQRVASVHVAEDGSIWAGSVIQGSEQGIYRTRGWNTAFDEVRFSGLSAPDLIPWVIFRVPTTGTLLVATELGQHTPPYDPPFLRSDDDGRTWRDVSRDVLWWHSIAIDFDPRTETIYTLQEGPGLYRSTDDGRTWTRLQQIPALGLWIGDGADRTIMLGEVLSGTIVGGAYRSMDGGVTVEPAGLEGKSVWAFARDAQGRLLALVAGEGIYATDDI